MTAYELRHLNEALDLLAQTQRQLAAARDELKERDLYDLFVIKANLRKSLWRGYLMGLPHARARWYGWRIGDWVGCKIEAALKWWFVKSSPKRTEKR